MKKSTWTKAQRKLKCRETYQMNVSRVNGERKESRKAFHQPNRIVLAASVNRGIMNDTLNSLPVRDFSYTILVLTLLFNLLRHLFIFHSKGELENTWMDTWKFKINFKQSYLKVIQVTRREVDINVCVLSR